MVARDNVVQHVQPVPPHPLEKPLHVKISVLRKPEQILSPMTTVSDVITSTPFVAALLPWHPMKSLN
jgi:hypothetical protein